MWTPITNTNPVWREYCSTLRELLLVTKKDNARRSVSGCKNCFSIFYPFNPNETTLHFVSLSFRSALDARTSDIRRAWVVEMCDEDMRQSLEYKLLVGLAKESGAFKIENGVEFVRLLRIVKGNRQANTQEYDPYEVCENYPAAEIGVVVEEMTRVNQLASDIRHVIEW